MVTGAFMSFVPLGKELGALDAGLDVEAAFAAHLIAFIHGLARNRDISWAWVVGDEFLVNVAAETRCIGNGQKAILLFWMRHDCVTTAWPVVLHAFQHQGVGDRGHQMQRRILGDRTE